MSKWVGRTVSKVEIQQLLSRGGMAEVYLGRHTTLDRPVAVKVLFSHLNEDPDLLERFRREARSVAALRHPNIVQVYDFDVADDLPYIVMELLQGIPLSDYLAGLRLKESSMPLDTVARLATGIAAALDYAHARGIVHRDIKPSNVYLRRESGPIALGEPLPVDVEPVLLDFGVMRVAEGDSAKTATGTVIGTPTYMSPEQANGEGVDARSDVYSFGVMLYEMISGKPPFDPDALTPTSMLIKHIFAPPPPLPLPNISPGIQAVFDRSLAKNREERYQHAGELAAGLHKAIAQAEESDLASMPTQISRPADLPTAVQPGTASNAEERGRVASAPEAVADTAAATSSDQATRMNSSPSAASLPVQPGSAEASSSVAAEPKRPRTSPYLAIGLAAVLVIAAVVVFGRNLYSSSGGSSANATPATPTITASSGAASQTSSPNSTAVMGGVGGAQAPGNLRFYDVSKILDEITLSVNGLAQPPDGSQYNVWLLGEGGETRQSMGVLDLKPGGTGELTYNDPGGENLLARFDSFEITAEPKGNTNPLPSGPVAYADALPQKALVHLKHLLVAFPSTAVQTSLCRGLFEQTTRLNEIAQAILAVQQAGDLARMKQDAEGLINLIEGVNGKHFGDRNGDSITTNFGDGYGLLSNGKNLGYVQGTFDHARLAAAAPDATANIKLHASHVMIAAQNLGDWAVQARDLNLRIVAADSTASASQDVRELTSLADRMLNGKDLNGNEKIDPVPGEAGAKLAYEHAHYMDDMFAYPKPVSPPTEGQTPVPTSPRP